MKIKGAEGTCFAKVDFFSGVFSIDPKIPFTKREAGIFGKVMSLVENQCIKEGIRKEDLGRGHLIISDDGSYSFEVDSSDGDAYGYNMHNIIYAMSKLREKNNIIFTMIVFAEELVHFIWPELSESKTKLKIIEILKPEIPQMSVELLEAFGISMEDY